MTRTKKSGRRLKRLWALCMVVTILSLSAALLCPGLLWDIDFLRYETLFILKRPSFDDTKLLRKIPGRHDFNIILISLDTLRADRLGCYGYERKTSPNIDALAEESVVFKNAFANAYNTLPSHMSMLTSLYPMTHKVNKHEDPALSSDFKTLPEILNEKGYRTAWIGPLSDPNLGLEKGYARGIDEFYPSLFSTDREGFNRDLFSDILRNPKEKFYFFIHSYINHSPYLYPRRFNYRFSGNGYEGRLPEDRQALAKKRLAAMKDDYEADPEGFLEKMAGLLPGQRKRVIESLKSADLSGLGDVIKVCHNNLPREYMSNFFFYGTIRQDITKEDISELSDKYDNGVYYVDFLFGALLDGLKKTDLLDKTVIIITSDHGEELFEHKGFDHENFYDHTVRVPLIVRIPGIKKGSEAAGLVQGIDILPMILETLGIEKPGYIQGKDLLSERVKNDFVFGYSFGNIYVRSRKWKYIMNQNGKEELYYLLSDPAEKHNLIDERSLIVGRYKRRLKDELIKWEIGQF